VTNSSCQESKCVQVINSKSYTVADGLYSRGCTRSLSVSKCSSKDMTIEIIALAMTSDALSQELSERGHKLYERCYQRLSN
jgi:hypothetical protein